MGSIYDLNERTLIFSINIIELSGKLQINIHNKIILSQLIRSATSIGANYQEASQCQSKKDFINKILYCRKESKETIYWLKLIKYFSVEIILRL